MGNVRNPLLKSTNALVSGTPVLNVESALAVQKQGSSSLVFIFDYNKPERNVVWTFANGTVRDNEYNLLVVSSTDWSNGVNGLFVASSVATVVGETGKLSTTEDALNLNAVVTVSKENKSTYLGIGSKPVYSIVFGYNAIDGFKVITWDYLEETDRDDVFSEVYVEAADAVFIEGVPTANAGVAATGVVAQEEGNSVNHVTVLTVDSTFGAIAGGANLALGKLLYTFPSGSVVVKSAKIDVALTAVDGNIDADTPDVGLGTTLASGANALLSAAGVTTEDILTGQTAADCSGTATVKAVATTKVIEDADPHTVYLNIADGWAASGEAALPVTGTVTIEWTLLG